MLQTDPVVDVIRRELRRISPDVRIDSDQIRDVLINEVIKREVLEGEQATEARKKAAKAATRLLRAKATKARAETATETSPEPV